MVTAREEAGRTTTPDGVTVEGVPLRKTLDDRYREWKRRQAPRQDATAPAPAPDPDASGGGDPRPGLLRTVRREIGGLLSFPDEGRGWLLRAGQTVRRLLPELRPAAVVSTGPPHSVHLATGLALRGRRVRWIADFRDPWMDEARLHLDVAWSPPAFALLERHVVVTADQVVTTTPELRDRLRQRYRDAPIRCLPNGVDLDDLPTRTPDPSAGFSLVHLGSLYLRRNPIPVLRAFALFLRQNPRALEQGSTFSFVGHMDPGYRARIQEVAREEGIADRVRILGVCPRDEALRILARCGASLVLAQGQGTAVPAKLYEAAGMGIPTLVVTEAGSATAGAGQRVGAAVRSPEDLEGMAQALRSAWTGEWHGRPPPGARLHYGDLATELEGLLLPP